jgi:hypothetical protein
VRYTQNVLRGYGAWLLKSNENELNFHIGFHKILTKDVNNEHKSLGP